MRTEQQMAAIVARTTKELHLDLAKKWGFPARVIARSTFDLALTMMMESGYTEGEIIDIVRQLTAELSGIGESTS